MAALQLNIADVIPAGALVTWGQGPAEPRGLTRALVEQRAHLRDVRVLLGLTLTDTVRAEHANHLTLLGLGGFGRNAPLWRAGALDVLPCHMSVLATMIRRRDIRIDVVFASVSPPDKDGRCSLGPVADYLVPALEAATTRVAEVNRHVPRTGGDTQVRITDFDHVVEHHEPLPEVAPTDHDDVDRRIAAHVADLVPEHAVVQVGIGATLGAIVTALRRKQDLGIHSGLLDDRLVDLIESGTVTNAFKEIDTGLTVATMALGSQRVYDFVHENASVSIRAADYTHDAAVLGRFDKLVSVNSALEVDLTGQVNAEMRAGDHVGTVGGLVDFARAATRAPQGRSIIALRSTSRDGLTSRIVSRLRDSIATLARSDVDTVVTEYGVADLRAATLAERARRLFAIAHPRHRDNLARASWRPG